jgi:HSP20 family protein
LPDEKDQDVKIDRWNPFKVLRKAPGAGGDGNTAPGLADPFRLMQEGLRDAFQMERWFGDFSPGVFQPRLDVVDEGEAVRISADLPGMERKDVEVLVEDDVLVLRGEKKLESTREEKGCYRVERAFGSFQRMIPLPEDVDAEHAEARFDKGVLTLRLPKRPGATPDVRKIEIK